MSVSTSFKYLCLCLVVYVLCAFSCDKGDFRPIVVPEYFNDVQVGVISNGQPVDENAHYSGSFKGFELKTKAYEGIHLVMGNDSIDTVFWILPGITEFRIENEETLYYRMFRDEIIVDVTDVFSPSLLDIRFTGNLDINSMSPFRMHVHFECVDSTKGYIRRWREDPTAKTKCWTR